eukprot:6819886-Prymnesium_polylepis.1
MLSLLLTSASGFQLASPPAAAALSRSGRIDMFYQGSWVKPKVGSKVDFEDKPVDVVWARAAWAAAQGESKRHAKSPIRVTDGQCYLIDSDDNPDSTKDYFFCPAPATDAKMTCEEMPEWFGTLPDGSSVYICTVSKAAA